jgi:LysM repeat protein
MTLNFTTANTDLQNQHQAQMDAQAANYTTMLAAKTDQLVKAQGRPAVSPPVVAGQTFFSIAQTYGLAVEHLVAWNPDVDPNAMPIGTELWLIDPTTVHEPATPPPPPPPPTTRFGLDISNLGPDKDLSEAQKLANHKSELQVTSLQYVRVFLQSRALGPSLWTEDERLAALKPGDGCHITTNLALRNNQQAFRSMLNGMPDHLREPGRVLWGVNHEVETKYPTATAIKGWLDDNQAMADILNSWVTGYQDWVVKTLLFYSQHVNPDYKGSWPKFYGGQNFGMIGVDCYHLQNRLNDTDAAGKPIGKYTPATELFKYQLEIKAQTGLPVCAPEWGGTRANTDPTGTGRAQAIRDGAALMRENGFHHAAWWCAMGEENPDGTRRNHHLQQGTTNPSPELVAYRELIGG